MYKLYEQFVRQTKQEQIKIYENKKLLQRNKDQNSKKQMKENIKKAMNINNQYINSKNNYKDNINKHTKQVYLFQRPIQIKTFTQGKKQLRQIRKLPNFSINNQQIFQFQLKPQNKLQIPKQFNQVQLFQCPQGCGRKFGSKQLQKHTKNCKKIFQQKRQKFKLKIVQEEAEKAKIQAEKIQNKAKKYLPAKNKKQESADLNISQIPKWKRDSQKFRNMLKSNKGNQNENKQSIALEFDDRISCPNCGRKFNQKAAERHIPICKNKKKK